MAKNRSEKSRYESKYSPNGYCTIAQYIVEVICEHKAAFEKKELPYRFWELEEWAKFFRSQVRAANKLVRKYQEKAIIQVLNDPKNFRTYTLYAKWLEPQFAEAHNKLILQEEIAARQAAERALHETNIAVGTNVRPEFKKRGRLDSL